MYADNFNTVSVYVLNLISSVDEVCLLLKKCVGQINSTIVDHAIKFKMQYINTNNIICSNTAFLAKSSFKSNRYK